jgi:hypothetical protein
MSKYKWVHHGGQTLYAVGINNDGTLQNPNDYPEQLVREAIQEADARHRQRRSDAAKKAAVTRHARQEQQVYRIAKWIVEGRKIGPRASCCICGRGLGDQESIQRGVGSECWQGVLSAIKRDAEEKGPRQ